MDIGARRPVGPESLLRALRLWKEFPLERLSTLERAFILAEAGPCRTVAEIRTQLKKEQHESVDAHLAGSSIQQQLRQRMTARIEA